MITCYHFPLAFSPEHTGELKQEYRRFSEILEKQGFVPAGYLDALRARLRTALDKLQITDYDQFRDSAGVAHALAHFTHDEHDILNLPWQLAVGDAEHLFYSRGATLRGKTELPPADPPHEGPLRILVMIAAPETGGEKGRLRYEDEQAQIEEAFGPLLRRGDIEIHFTYDGSVAALRQALDAPRYDIFHFSGHSSFEVADWANPNAREGVVLLEDEVSMNPRPCPAAAFAALLNERPDKSPSLVFLSSCQSAQGGSGAGFTGVAAHLLEAGIPGVVAMSHSIADVFATLFAAAFYQGISEGYSVPFAFSKALKISEKGNPALGLPSEFWTSQSLIPQLYLTQKIQTLTQLKTQNSKPKTGNFWQTGRLRDKLQKIHRFAGREDRDFIFIGRRREQKQIRKFLDAGAPVFLRGQGGLGKTALAVHTAERLLLADPDEVQVFMFDENTFRIGQVTDELLDFLKNEQKQVLQAHQIRSMDKAWEKFLTALQAILDRCKPVFIFDNLESFQPDGGGDFRPEHGMEWDIISTLAGVAPLLLTGRYPLPALPDLGTVELHEPTRSDFAIKCRYLTISEKIPPGEAGKPVFDTLFRSFGGNYRALEFFDTFYREKKEAFGEVLETLGGFIQKHEAQPELLAKMSENLVFERLLGLLSAPAREALALLAHFRRPVLPLAVEMQRPDLQNVPAALERLSELTLAEKTIDENRNAFFYVPTLTRLLLENNTPKEINLTWIQSFFKIGMKLGLPAKQFFDDYRAGEYYEYVTDNVTDEAEDLLEAFTHFVQNRNVEKVNKIGERLTGFFFITSQFQQAQFIAEQTFETCGDDTNGNVLNKLGLILDLFGQLGKALFFYEKKLKIDIKTFDRSGEAVSLNNIGQIFKATGDFDRALYYMEQSLKIRYEIGDRQSLGTILNNLGTLAYAKGEYNRALDYLEQGLKIRREIDDQFGEGRTLINLATMACAKGDFDRALVYSEKSLKIQQKISDRSGEATTLNNLASIAYAKGDYGRALVYFEQSLKIQIEIGDRSGEGNSLHNIAPIYSANGDNDLALFYLEQSLKIRQEIGDRSGEGATLNSISQIYSAKGDYISALEYLEESLKIIQEIGDQAGLCAPLHNMALIILEHNEDIDGFIEKEQSAFEIALEIGNAQGVFSIGRVFGRVLCQNGATKQGLQILRLALEVGQRAGFPGTEDIEAAIQHFSA